MGGKRTAEKWFGGREQRRDVTRKRERKRDESTANNPCIIAKRIGAMISVRLLFRSSFEVRNSFTRFQRYRPLSSSLSLPSACLPLSLSFSFFSFLLRLFCLSFSATFSSRCLSSRLSSPSSPSFFIFRPTRRYGRSRGLMTSLRAILFELSTDSLVSAPHVPLYLGTSAISRFSTFAISSGQNDLAIPVPVAAMCVSTYVALSSFFFSHPRITGQGDTWVLRPRLYEFIRGKF